MKTRKLSRNSWIYRFAAWSSHHITWSDTTDTCELVSACFWGILHSFSLTIVFGVLVATPLYSIWYLWTTNIPIFDAIRYTGEHGIVILFFFIELVLMAVVAFVFFILWTLHNILHKLSEIETTRWSLETIGVMFTNIKDKTCARFEIVDEEKK